MEGRSGPRRIRLWAALGVVVAAGVAAVILFGGRGADVPDPPDPDLATMEPEVREAIRTARDAARAEPDSAARWGALGTAFLAHELKDEAAVAFGAAADLDPADYRWPYLEARSLLDASAEAAGRAAETAAALRPGYAPAWLVAGEAADRRGEAEAAERHFRAVLDISGAEGASGPNGASARFHLARILAGGDGLEEARVLLEEAERLAPEAGAVPAALARLHRRAGEPDLARAAATRARGLDPELQISDPLMDRVNAAAVSVVGKEQRAFAAERAGRPDVAERLLREMIAARPEAADLYYNLANNLSRQGRNAEALPLWGEALERNPDHVPTLVNSAIVLAQVESDFAEAERRCRRALEIQPNHPGALSSLGSIAALSGRLREAVGWFERSLLQDPERAGTHDSIAQVLAAERRFGEAIPHYRIAVEKEPLRGDYRLGLAAALAAAGDFGGAWATVHEGRRFGVELPPEFVRELERAMPDPGGAC